MNLSLIVSTLLAVARSGLVSTILPDILTFLQATRGLNPLTQPLEYIAQLDLLRSTFLTQLPGLAIAEAQGLNTLFSNEIQDVIAKAKAAAAAASVAKVPATPAPAVAAA